LNGLTRAYIGDAYYELQIRQHLIINHKLTHVDQLHKSAIRYTSGVAQAKIIKALMLANRLTEDEISYFKNGRNNSGPGRKNVDAQTYHFATGFEALIGHLYLTNITRADALILESINLIERGEIHG
jgi:ribonuclease III family protein